MNIKDVLYLPVLKITESKPIINLSKKLKSFTMNSSTIKSIRRYAVKTNSCIITATQE
jgi:Leucine-rich repeat (LRR) protein